MKEREHPPMDPILEECYKMKEEFAARFKTMQELVDYLKAEKYKEQSGRLEVYIATTSQMPQTRLMCLCSCPVQEVIVMLEAGYSNVCRAFGGCPVFFVQLLWREE